MAPSTQTTHHPSNDTHSNTTDCHETGGGHDTYYDHSLDALVAHTDHDEAFLHLYYLMIFVALIWIVGKLSVKIGMPDLVGQIMVGVLMGPNALNFVGDHGSEFLIVIGEIGLIMLVVEAGIDVDIGMLKLIGPRGLAVAVFGSMFPLLLGTLMASLIFKNTLQSSIAIGACFAPTSMGIALNVLKKAKILNTPTGQLIIASAILDDVIALMLLSELNAMKDPTLINIALPLVVSPVLILFFGYLAIRVVPRLIKKIMTKIPQKYHENSILFLLFLSTFGLVPLCHYAGSSHLLGAFLAGLMFCTDHTVHHAWKAQIKRILLWMLKIFFACTIGFAIPVNQFANGTVIGKGCAYTVCMIGKLATGIFAKPMIKKEFLTISFSMSAWGEFAFILATASYEEGTIAKTEFSAVLLAVMLSVIISPYALRLTVSYFQKKQQKQLDKQLELLGTDGGHPVYYAIMSKARGSWGHQDKVLHEIFNLKLEIIDFRAWHAPEYNYSHDKPLTKESFYVQDSNLVLPPTKYLEKEDKDKLKERIKDIKKQMKTVLGEEATIIIKRWLPGLQQKDDFADPIKRRDSMKKRRPSYCRRQAFKQAHSIMSLGNITEFLEEELKKENAEAELAAIESKNPQFAQALQSNSSIRSSIIFGLKAVGQNQPLKKDKKKSKPKKRRHRRKHRRSHKRGTDKKNVKYERGHVEDPDMHSGAGHGGQAKGVGALPHTSSIIDIRSHFDTKKTDNDDSISYIYADEDAEHHQLPEYHDREEYSKADSNYEKKNKKNDIVLTPMNENDNNDDNNDKDNENDDEPEPAQSPMEKDGEAQTLKENEIDNPTGSSIANAIQLSNLQQAPNDDGADVNDIDSDNDDDEDDEDSTSDLEIKDKIWLYEDVKELLFSDIDTKDTGVITKEMFIQFYKDEGVTDTHAIEEVWDKIDRRQQGSIAVMDLMRYHESLKLGH